MRSNSPLPRASCLAEGQSKRLARRSRIRGPALIVTGRSSERSAALTATLASSGLSYVTFSVSGEPTTEMMRDGVRMAQAEACDVVIGFGGGSAIDAAKAIATLIANGGDPLDYLEGMARASR